jgi:hypothetical protein
LHFNVYQSPSRPSNRRSVHPFSAFLGPVYPSSSTHAASTEVVSI